MRILALTLCMLLLCGCSPRLYTEENIGELYDQDWILGKDRAAIEQKYGKLDRWYAEANIGCYNVNEYDKGILGLPDSGIHDSYFICFEDGLAVKAYFAQTSQGG